ncbi:hypothetical protein PT273_02915 [Orbaceae bacterium ESL0727]|nr:hypothetical protein [Orbaceae bacterium ESL0727]
MVAFSSSFISSSAVASTIKADTHAPKNQQPIIIPTANGATPAEVATAVPTTFTLYATVNGTRTKIYSFKLSKWFIVNPYAPWNSINTTNGYDVNYCSRYGTGYRIPHIAELTNANGNFTSWTGSLGSQGTIYYTRQIGGGLFAEWGGYVRR